MLPVTLFGLGLLGLANAATFTQPLRESGPDPFVVYDHDTSEYLFMQTKGNILLVSSAPTLGETGVFSNEKKVYQDADMLDRGNVWAPEIHKVDGRWHIYYTVNGNEVWAVSGGANPFDEYTGPTKLFDKYGIDGTVLQVGGNNYFVWCCHSIDVSDVEIDGSSLCISPLVTATSIDSGKIAVISRPEGSWEQDGGNTNEGPQPVYWAGETYITYSASHCTTASYSLGLLHLTGGDPMDPASWTKKTDGPVFSSGNGEYGPGHNGIFISPDGTELWNVYHATTNQAGSCGDDRSTFAMKVDTSNGLNFGTPVKKGTVTEGPSGEPGFNSPKPSPTAAASTLPLSSDTVVEAPATQAEGGASIVAVDTQVAQPSTAFVPGQWPGYSSAAPNALFAEPTASASFAPVALVADPADDQSKACKAKRGKMASRAAKRSFP